MRHAFLPLLFLSISLAAQTLYAREIPKLTGRVVDEADILSSVEEQALTQKLADYEKQTTNQIVVVTIPSLEGEVLEEFSIRIAEKWKIGQKDKDNGVILLIARQDRKIRIEVGYGLEGVLTDGRCGGIIRNFMTPLFRQEKFFEGISAAVDAMMKYISGEEVSFPETLEDATGTDWVEIITIGFGFSFMVLPILFLFFGQSKTSWSSGGSGGSWDSGGGGYSGGGDGGSFSGGGGSFGGGGASGGW